MGVEFETDKWSLSLDVETTYGVKPAVYSADYVLLCSMPEFTMGREMQELNRAVASAFTVPPNVAGSTHGGSVSFTCDMRSQATDYDDPTDALAVGGETLMLKEVLGGAYLGTSAAGDVTGAPTAVAVDTTATEIPEGECVIFADTGATSVNGVGWVKDTTSPTPFTHTMFADMFDIPSSGDDVYGTVGLYPDDLQPDSYTFLFQGSSTEHGLYLLGLVPTACTLRIENGKIIEMDVEARFDGWEYDDSIGAGVETPDALKQIPASMQVNGGRLVIDGQSGGTADSTGTCGIGLITVELTTEQRDRPCHGGPQGFAGITLKRMPARISFNVPWTGDDITAGVSKWDDSLINNTTFSLSVQTGLVVGSVFAMLCPALVVVEQPTLSEVDGVMSWGIVASPLDGGYSGDTGTTDPANKPIRIAIG